MNEKRGKVNDESANDSFADDAFVDDAFVDDRQLEEPLLLAVNQVRDEPISEDVMARVERNLLMVGPDSDSRPTATPTATPTNSTAVEVRRGRNSVLWSGLAVALVLLLAVGAFFFRQRSAWAEVIAAVSEQPWMRLTLQDPGEKARDGAEMREVVFWFKGDGSVAAVKQPEAVRWLNVAKNDEWVYKKKSGKIHRGLPDTRDSEQVQIMLALLDRLNAPLPKKGDSGTKLVESSADEVSEDGKTWDRFTAVFERANGTPRRQTLVVKADQETHRPVELSILRGEAKDKLPPMTFRIDYPEKGPRDIFALGAPRDAAVLDVRSLAKYFKRPKRVSPSNFEIIVVRGTAKRPLAWITEAQRFRRIGDRTTAERADLMRVVKLSEDVYFGDYGPSKTPPLKWWAEQVDLLPMETYDSGSETNLPQNACYRAYGGPDSYQSAHPADGTLRGLEDTVEIRGPKHSTWLDIKRDMIVRRTEQVDEKGVIHVWQCDEVVQGPNGNWYPARLRRGNVAKRGAAFDNEQQTDGITVTLSLTHFKFPK